MNREREIQIIAEELSRQVPPRVRTRTDGSFYLDPEDCDTMATHIVNRLESQRRP